MVDETETQPESLLPYDEWAEDAARHVMVRALQHVATEGLPGEHHFYITFRTDFPGVVMPDRLRAQYPQEITIVLQHQFWDLAVDEAARVISVGLSFGGIGSTLRVPIAAVTQFADPYIRFGRRFSVSDPTPKPEATAPAAAAQPQEQQDGVGETPAQVVSLDAFRRRTNPRES